MANDYFSHTFKNLDLEKCYFLAGIVNIIDNIKHLNGRPFTADPSAIECLETILDTVLETGFFEGTIDEKQIRIRITGNIEKSSPDLDIIDSGSNKSFSTHCYALLKNPESISSENAYCQLLKKISKAPLSCEYVGGTPPKKDLLVCDLETGPDGQSRAMLKVTEQNPIDIANAVADIIYDGAKVSIKTSHKDMLGSITAIAGDRRGNTPKELFYKRFNQDINATTGNTDNQAKYLLDNLPLFMQAIIEASSLIENYYVDLVEDRYKLSTSYITDGLFNKAQGIARTHKQSTYQFYTRIQNCLRKELGLKLLSSDNKGQSFKYTRSTVTSSPYQSLVDFYNGFSDASNTSSFRYTYSPIDFICYMSLVRLTSSTRIYSKIKAKDIKISQKNIRQELDALIEQNNIFHGCFRRLKSIITSYVSVIYTKEPPKTKADSKLILRAVISTAENNIKNGRPWDWLPKGITTFFGKQTWLDLSDSGNLGLADMLSDSDLEEFMSRYNTSRYNEARQKRIPELKWSAFKKEIMDMFPEDDLFSPEEPEADMLGKDDSDMNTEDIDTVSGSVRPEDQQFALDLIDNLFFGDYYLIVGLEGIYNISKARDNFIQWANTLKPTSSPNNGIKTYAVVVPEVEFSKKCMTIYVGGKKGLAVFKLIVRPSGSSRERIVVMFDNNGFDKILSNSEL